MAERSVLCILQNNSDYDLTFSNFDVTNGVPTTSPPKVIPKNSSGQWETENGPPLTGTSGNTTFIGTSNNSEFSVFCSWNNPFIGDDIFSASTTLSGGNITSKSADGDNATVYYTFTS